MTGIFTPTQRNWTLFRTTQFGPGKAASRGIVAPASCRLSPRRPLCRGGRDAPPESRRGQRRYCGLIPMAPPVIWLSLTRDLCHSELSSHCGECSVRRARGHMFKILHAEFLAPGIKRFVIEASRISHKYKPGQFVILRIYEQGERIPLTIEQADPERGTIRLVVQSIGKTTNLLNSLNAGDSILNVVGPLGKPSEIEKFGTVVVMGGGVGTAMAYPTAVALKHAGNRVISIVGARNKELVILEKELREASDTL